MEKEKDFLEVRRQGNKVLLNYRDGLFAVDQSDAQKIVQMIRSNSQERCLKIGNRLELRKFNTYVELSFFRLAEDALEEKIYTLATEQAVALARGIEHALATISREAS